MEFATLHGTGFPGMDTLDIGMYFPVMRLPNLASGITPLSGPSGPLGSVEFGGRLCGTSGTGFSQFRVYGMYALVLLLDGGGRYRDRLGVDRRLSPGDLFMVFPDHAHQYGPEAGEHWDEVFIAFKGAAFEAWRSHGLAPSHPIWNIDPPHAVARRMIGILNMPATTLSQSTAMAAAVHQLIADLIERRPTGREDWLERAGQLLGGGSGSPTPPEIARMLGISHDHFRKIFKAATGQSPSAYRRRSRLAQAALMLQRTDIKLDMIAECLGFCDGFHLSKAFKAEYGQAPADYRRNQGPPC